MVPERDLIARFGALPLIPRARAHDRAVAESLWSPGTEGMRISHRETRTDTLAAHAGPLSPVTLNEHRQKALP
jgi:hypothetical protein